MTLSFKTTQTTACRYSVGTALAFPSMTVFDSNGPTVLHEGAVAGLSSDPRITNTVYFRCDFDPVQIAALTYRSVAAPASPFPRIGSIWTGGYLYDHDSAAAEKIQLYLGSSLTASQASRIRGTNPTVRVLPSINATETTSGVPAVPEGYFLKDIHGNKIQDRPGNYLLNLTNPQVATFLARSSCRPLQSGTRRSKSALPDSRVRQRCSWPSARRTVSLRKECLPGIRSESGRSDSGLGRLNCKAGLRATTVRWVRRRWDDRTPLDGRQDVLGRLDANVAPRLVPIRRRYDDVEMTGYGCRVRIGQELKKGYRIQDTGESCLHSRIYSL